MVVALQRLDEQINDRQPNRAAPVGVAAEKTGPGFPGRVFHAVLISARRKHIRVGQVKFGKGTDAEGREEFVLMKQISQQADETVARRNREESMPVSRRRILVAI